MLSERNRELLARIAREKPDSLTQLAGRNKSKLSRTLKTMSHYGLVELKEGQRGTLVLRVPYDRVCFPSAARASCWPRAHAR